MSSRKSFPPTDLDQLLRDTLNARVSTQLPPDRVWRRIRRFLTGQGNRGPLWRSSVIVQAIALLLVLSAIQTQFPLHRLLQIQQPTAIALQSGKPAIRLAQEIAFVDTATFRRQTTVDAPLGFSEDKLLDVEVRREMIIVADKVQRASSVANSQPPIVVPRDALPHNYFAVNRRPTSFDPAMPAMVDVSVALGSGIIR